MHKNRLFLLCLLTISVIAVSCKKDDSDEVVDESKVLATYLESSDSPSENDYINTNMPSLITASELKALNDIEEDTVVYIMDLRAEGDFDLGHIENAVNVLPTSAFTHIASLDTSDYQKIAIVCYTGQTSSFVTSLLRLKGYKKVYALKWGMCSWHSDFAERWITAITNGNSYASEFTSAPALKNALGDMPELTTKQKTGSKIFNIRVSSILSEGFSTNAITSAQLFSNLSDLSDYYIINYWPTDQYENPGHISGAIQYTPKESMKLAADLKTLPIEDKTIVVYCDDGHASAFLVAYLRLLGYDAKSLLFGTNGMIYDLMATYNQANPDKKMSLFSASEIKDFPYVTE